MKIPLAVVPTNDKLIIYHNGTELEIDHPLKPFILAQKDMFPEVQAPVEKWIKVPEYEEREYLRLSFSDLEGYTDFRKRSIDRQRFILANSFIEQLYISQPEYLLKYPHTNDLKIMFFDIEVATKGDGFFPKPITNEILCIGYSIWLYKNDGTKVKTKHKIVKGFNLNGKSIGSSTDGDRALLLEFINDVRTEDPDIMAGYNSQEFDFPYIMDRCKLLAIEMKGIGRHNKAPYLIEDQIRIPGRIHFDIYNSNAGVLKDQTLFGIKSRTLKEIARFYKVQCSDIEVPEHIENLLSLLQKSPDALYFYLDADINRTEHVGQVYLRNCITLAEMLGVPLNSIITMYSSFVPKLFLARKMEQKGLICTDSNFQRYNNNNGSIALLGTKFEGALVGLYKDGYFPQVYKLDFSSMYPSCVDKDTEILTRRGWIQAENISNKDLIKTISDDLISEKFQKPQIWNINPYKGPMYSIINNDVDQILTPNHRIPYITKRGNRKVEKAEIINWSSRINFIVAANTSGRTPTIEEERVLGIAAWIITEGNISGNRITISQNYIKNKQYCKRIIHFARKCGLKFKIKKRNNRPDIEVTLYKTQQFQDMFSNTYKDIPHWIFELDIEHRQFFIEELIKGDGSISGGKKVFVQKNKVMIERLQELCNISGYRATISKEYTDKRNGRKWFYLYTSKRNTSSFTKPKVNTDRTSFNIINYDGLVYCPTFNDDSMFFIRRNGKVCLTKNSIQTWNLGPDTTSFVAKLPYTGRYTFKRDSSFNWYRIPDANFSCDILIKVRNNVDGVLKGEISKLRTERVKIKKQLKTATDTEKPTLDSQQYAIKVILNSIYGLLGLKSSTYGDMMSAMMVTAMCRWTTGQVTRKLRDNLIELDTDGLMLDKEVSEKEINEWLNALIDKKFNIKDNYMQMELDDFGRAYFYAMKNYVVEENGKYIIHGSSFKASRAAKIVDRAINLAIQHVFNGLPKDEVLARALDFKNLPIEDFEERVKLSKEPREYDDAYDMRLFLAKQMEMKTGQIATQGTQINYVVAKRALPFPELKPYYKIDGKNYTFIKWVDEVKQLDFNYYEDLVLKALDKFGIKKNIQLSLFGDDFDSKPSRTKQLDVVPTEDLEIEHS